ncbi:MAG: hypothetical protein QOI59_4711 [Gammaproteobacteria bacterium]|nr:hypothetical protein [Gammaproteobacteria bacterium]
MQRSRRPRFNTVACVKRPSHKHHDTDIRVALSYHNLSDADFSNSIAAVTESQVLLASLAPKYGFDPANVTTYNNKFRNVVLAYLSPERLSVLYTNGGLPAVQREIDKLQRVHAI